MFSYYICSRWHGGCQYVIYTSVCNVVRPCGMSCRHTHILSTCHVFRTYTHAPTETETEEFVQNMNRSTIDTEGLAQRANPKPKSWPEGPNRFSPTPTSWPEGPTRHRQVGEGAKFDYNRTRRVNTCSRLGTVRCSSKCTPQGAILDRSCHCSLEPHMCLIYASIELYLSLTEAAQEHHLRLI